MSTISAGTTSGTALVNTGDTSGNLELQSSGVTKLTVGSGGVTLASALPVGSGGTGATTLTANNVILGNGTSAVQLVAPGSSGNVLTSNGTTWASASAPIPGATGVGSIVMFSSSQGTSAYNSAPGVNLALRTGSPNSASFVWGAMSAAISSYSAANSPSMSWSIPLPGGNDSSPTIRTQNIQWCPLLNMWVATGGSTTEGALQMYSPNGIDWIVDMWINQGSADANWMGGVVWDRYGGARTLQTAYFYPPSNTLYLYGTTNGDLRNRGYTTVASFSSSNESLRACTVDNGSANTSVMFLYDSGGGWRIYTATNALSFTFAGYVYPNGLTGNRYGARQTVVNSTTAYMATSSNSILFCQCFPSVSIGTTQLPAGSTRAFDANDSFILCATTSNFYYSAVSTSPSWSTISGLPSWGTVLEIYWTTSAWLVRTTTGWYANTNTNPSTGSFTFLGGSSVVSFGGILWNYNAGGNDYVVSAARKI